MPWTKLDSTTLTGTAVDITTAAFDELSNLNLLEYSIRSSATANTRWQFGTSGSVDTGANYSSRRSIDGGSEITAVDQNYVWFNGDSSGFTVGFMINISGVEKLCMGKNVYSASTGAGTAPSRQEWNGKYDITTGQVDIINADGGTSDVIAVGSNLSVIGTD